jgi:hypothetical protein
MSDNIEKLKNLFEERVIEIQSQIIRTGTDATKRVMEILENGNEMTCQVSTAKSEDQQKQETQIRNMISFINTNTEEIKEIIIRSNKQTELSEYVERMYVDQRRDTEKLELQHNAMFEKEEENRMILGEAKLKLEWIMEAKRINGENQCIISENQGNALSVQGKIEESQKEIKRTLETIKEDQITMKKELEKDRRES